MSEISRSPQLIKICSADFTFLRLQEENLPPFIAENRTKISNLRKPKTDVVTFSGFWNGHDNSAHTFSRWDR